MTHPNLFDMAEAQARRDEGITRVQIHHGAEVERIVGVIIILAKTQAEITSDDVHAQMAAQGMPEPRQPNALGAAFRKAATAQIIEDTGRAIKSARPEAHARRIPVWGSRIRKVA